MKEIDESTKNNGNKSGEEKKIPIIQTLKPKKRLTKADKELIEATNAVMEAIARQQNAKI